MHFTYCPQCGTRLIPRTLGDDADVPWCKSCNRPFFDMFASCIITAVVNELGGSCAHSRSPQSQP